MGSNDWSLIQSFLAVAETGSLSAAARKLGRSQPTLGRHIQKLEQALGSPLFERHARGLSLSETALAIGLSLAQTKREWALTKAWLLRELQTIEKLT